MKNQASYMEEHTGVLKKSISFLDDNQQDEIIQVPNYDSKQSIRTNKPHHTGIASKRQSKIDKLDAKRASSKHLSSIAMGRFPDS